MAADYASVGLPWHFQRVEKRFRQIRRRVGGLTPI